jgi:hypothetical protein
MGKEESEHICHQSLVPFPSTHVESTFCNPIFTSPSSFRPNKFTYPAAASNPMISPPASVRVIFVYTGQALSELFTVKYMILKWSRLRE